MPETFPVSRLRSRRVIKADPANRQLVVGLGVTRRLIREDHRRGHRRAKLTPVVQMHDLKQPLKMAGGGGADQQAAKGIVGRQPHAPIRIGERTAQGVDRRLIPDHPQGQRRGLAELSIPPSQQATKGRRAVVTVDIRGEHRGIGRRQVAAIGDRKPRASYQGRMQRDARQVVKCMAKYLASILREQTRRARVRQLTGLWYPPPMTTPPPPLPAPDQAAVMLRAALGQLDFARRYTSELLDSVPPSRWYEFPSGWSSCIAWQVGHLAVSQYGLLMFRIRGRRPEDLELIPGTFRKAYGRGSTPSRDQTRQPTPEELRERLTDVDRRARQELHAVSAETLLEPVDMPYAAFPVKLGAILFCPLHEQLHAGQIGGLRRAMGLEPLR